MRQATSRDSAVMLAALGILAYATSMITHEALGHGGYCLAAGGHNVMISAWWETCDFPGVPSLGIKAAGPIVQFVSGLVAWLLLHRLPLRAVTLRCLLWLYMTYDLLDSSSYLAFSGITNLGDAAEIIAQLHPSIVWRGGLILLGSLLYFLAIRAATFELNRFAGTRYQRRHLFRFVFIPYTAAGVFACLTAASNQMLAHGTDIGLAVASPALNQTMGHGAAIGLAVASSFGAGSGMLALPNMQSAMADKESSPPVYVRWSIAWFVFTAFVISIFLFYIGPGLR